MIGAPRRPFRRDVAIVSGVSPGRDADPDQWCLQMAFMVMTASS